MDIQKATQGCVHRPDRYVAKKGEKLTTHRFFDRLSGFLLPGSIVIGETGISMFCLAETLLPRGSTFLGQIFYGSIGYALGATLGVSMALKSPSLQDKKREVVLCIGDGSFQETCQDLSTIIRHDLNPIIFLVNNEGYTIERSITDKHPIYNDIQNWKYHKLPEIFDPKGQVKGIECWTEDGLEDALGNYLEKNREQKKLSFIELHFDKWDCPPALLKAGQSMAEKNEIAK